MDGRPRPAMVRHLPCAALSRERRVKSRNVPRRYLMDSSERQANRSPGISALEKLWLARWATFDLAIFGIPLVAITVALLLAAWPWRLLAVVPLIFLLWLISFFRNPPRKIPDDPRVIVSPADGTVVDVTP